MSEKVGNDLTQNIVPCADTLDSIQMESIIQVLSAKRHQSIIAFNEIGDDRITVIIAVGVEYTEDGICLMLRQNGHDCIVGSEE